MALAAPLLPAALRARHLGLLVLPSLGPRSYEKKTKKSFFFRKIISRSLCYTRAVNALFALALLVSSVRAGVVMPVESGVAPAGVYGEGWGIPEVAAPGGAGLGAPSLGSAADLRGSLPALPAPVPGLFSPVRHFVGETAAAVAASVRPEAGAVRPAPGRDAAQPGRASDRTPALPGKVSPGSPSLALSRDRTPAAEAPPDRT